MKSLVSSLVLLTACLFSYISYSQCVKTFPYTQNFEKFTNLQTAPIACDPLVKGDTADGWIQDPNDDGEWRADTAGTPSTATGPGSTITTSGDGTGKDYIPGTRGGVYLYTEGTGATYCPGAEINLLSPCFDFSGTSYYRLKFAYHMHGGTMGSLHIDILDSNVWVNDVWTVSGNQGTNWQLATVPLFKYNKSNTVIRIRAKMGSGFTTDCAIDAIRVEAFTPNKYDAILREVKDTSREYYSFTKDHVDSVQYHTVIKNNGLLTLSGIKLKATSGKWSHTQNIGSLASDQDTFVVFNKKLFPDTADMKNILFEVSHSQADDDSSNNSKSLVTGYSDSIFARDDGTLGGGLGYTNGRGQLGQMFRLKKKDTLTAVRFYLTNPTVGDSVKVHLYEFNNTPGLLITSTKSMAIPSTGVWMEAYFDCDQILNQGEYFIAIEQMDLNNLSLSYTSHSFTPKVGYANNGAGWTSLEPNFSVALTLRMSFGTLHRPVVKISSLDSICQKQKLVLNTSGADKYEWGPAGNVQIPGNKSTFAVSDTNFRLTLNAWDACDVPALEVSKDIVVKRIPDGSITADTTICNGKSITLNVNTGSNYSWIGGPKNMPWTVSPQALTTYSAIVDSSNGCRRNLSADINVQTIFPVTSNDTTICSGNKVTIEASGGDNYSWTPGTTGAQQTVQPDTTTEYIVKVGSSLGCEALDTVTITVDKAPDLKLTHDTILCFGKRFDLEASGADNYQWKDGPATAKYNILPILGKWYYVTASNNNGCEKTDSVQIIVAPIPKVSLREDTTICEGTSILLKAETTDKVEYIWSTKDTSSSITVSPDSLTNYSVKVFNEGNCTDSADVNIDVDPLPTVIFSHTLKKRDLTIDNKSENGDTYSWDFGDSKTSTDKSPFHRYDADGDYNIKYSVTNNCGTLDSSFDITVKTIGILEVDALISFDVFPQPADAQFKIRFNKSLNSDVDVQIFDLRGRLIKELSKQNVSHKGELLIDIRSVSSGMYLMQIKSGEQVGKKKINIIH